MKILQLLQPTIENWNIDSAWSGITRDRFTDNEFNLAYYLVNKYLITNSEIYQLAKQLNDQSNWDRGLSSAIFLLSRMYIIVHGRVPQGMSKEQAETFFVPSHRMEKWAIKNHLDPQKNINKAKQRIKNISKKLTRQEAGKIMFNYYAKNKHKLVDRSEISNHRDSIISQIMKGIKPKQAFSSYILHRKG